MDDMAERPKAPVEARSLLTQVVETQLLPPERFRGRQEGEVVDIKRIGETVATLRKFPDHYEAILFGGKGDTISIPLDPSSHKLADIWGNEYIKIKADSLGGAADPSGFFSKLGFNNAGQLQNKWYAKIESLNINSYGGYDQLSQFKKRDNFYLPVGDWRMGILWRDNKEKTTKEPGFIFTAEENWFRVEPNHPFDKTATSVSDENVGEIVTHGRFKLPQGLGVKREETIFLILDKDNKEVASFNGTSPIVDPANPNLVYFINTGRVYQLDTTGVAKRQTRPKVVSQIKVVDPREIDFEPNGNFLVIRSGDNKLAIVDKETGDVARSFEGIKGPVLVDEQGDILYADGDNKLREIQTNFQAIPKSGDKEAQKKRDEDLQQLRDRFANLNLDEITKQKPTEAAISEKAVADTLRQTIARQVSDKITQGTDPEEIEEILDKLLALKNDPVNRAYGEVIDEFVGQAKGKLNGIRLGDLEKQLADFDTSLADIQSVGDTIGLDEQYAQLLDARQKIEIGDVGKRRELERRLRDIETKKDGLIGKYQAELVEAAQTTLPQIEELIKETGSLEELGAFGTTSETIKFETMLANIHDPQLRRELRDRLNLIRTEQRQKLESTGRQLEEQQRMRWAEVVEEVREDLNAIREQILGLGDARDIDRFGRNPLVTAWRAKLYALPPEFREVEEKRLDMIMGTRKKDLEHRRDLGAIGEGDELKFGNATFPIYKEPPKLWQPKLVPIGAGMYAELIFEDSLGRVFKPDGEGRTVVSPDPNDEKTKQVIERYKKAADEYFRSIKRQVPDFDEHWKITTYHMSKLEEIAEGLNLQLLNHRGILILQGEAGTGKNVVVDMLANLSNREVVPVLCNENSVKEDLTYEFYYDPEKGTYKLPSRLVEGIQKPGTIILFDEINALKPGIAKMLNSLFDYRRRIYLPEGGKQREIITDPTVMFMGTMNPQNYAGVNRLSPEVKSRARVVDFDYPPFEERGNRTQYKSDEAEMLGAYVDSTGDLKPNEFRLCWDYIVNRDTSNGADAILGTNPQIEQDMRRIYDVIRVANRLREMYRAYLIGDSNEPMDFPTSLREVTDIVMEMNHRQGLKRIIKRVIIPKIDDLQQKRLVDQTIDAVLPSE